MPPGTELEQSPAMSALSSSHTNDHTELNELGAVEIDEEEYAVRKRLKSERDEGRGLERELREEAVEKNY